MPEISTYFELHPNPKAYALCSAPCTLHPAPNTRTGMGDDVAMAVTPMQGGGGQQSAQQRGVRAEVDGVGFDGAVKTEDVEGFQGEAGAGFGGGGSRELSAANTERLLQAHNNGGGDEMVGDAQLQVVAAAAASHSTVPAPILWREFTDQVDGVGCGVWGVGCRLWGVGCVG